MNAPGKLGAYGVVLALALGGGVAAGAAFGPEADDADAPAHDTHTEAADDMTTQTALPGLAISDRGYTFRPASTALAPGGGEFRFTVTGPDGDIVDDYTVEHDKELHLIVASRDLERFVHVHPERDADGLWSVSLPALTPGAYRAFADFRADGGPALTLGADVTVAGEYRPPADREPSTRSSVDGFDVELVGEPRAGADASLVVRATVGGRPAVLEPYLGANGHLVALRDGDLAYLHVHPEEGDGAAGAVPFGVYFPSPGRYRLFFDFQVDGVVRTADFTVDVGSPAGDEPAHGPDADAHGSDSNEDVHR